MNRSKALDFQSSKIVNIRPEYRFSNRAKAAALQDKFWTDPINRRIGYGTEDDLYKTFDYTDFGGFAEKAYSNPEGYAIRWNPVTRKKEMFVAGTRRFSDWVLNFEDTKLTHPAIPIKPVFGTGLIPKVRPIYGSAVQKYHDIARKEGVDVIYGHSRGGAIVSDIPRGPYQRIGLNAATFMAKNKGKVINFRGTSLFDRAIGFDPLGRKVVRKNTAFHKVWKKNANVRSNRKYKWVN